MIKNQKAYDEAIRRNEEKKEKLKTLLGSYLIDRGIIAEDRTQQIRCPNPDHGSEDKNKSARYYADQQNIHCWKCATTRRTQGKAARFDIFDLVEFQEGLTDFKEQEQYIKDHFGLTDDDIVHMPMPERTERPKVEEIDPSIDPYNLNPEMSTETTNLLRYVTEYDYLRKRGISDETAKAYNVGYESDGSYVVFPTVGKSLNKRNTDPIAKNRYLKAKDLKSEPFNLASLNHSDPVFIVEGEIDALSILETQHGAIGLGGVNGAERFLEWIKAFKRVNKPVPPLILSFDNDEAGRSGAELLKKDLEALDLLVTKSNICGDLKDPNDALLADRDEFVRRIETAIKISKRNAHGQEIEHNHMKRSGLARLDTFLEEREINRYTPPLATGFAEIDNIFYGGLRPGYSVLGAMSSLGKTTFALQLCDNIAKQGHDVLFVSLEQDANELIAKSISREYAAIQKELNLKNSNNKMPAQEYYYGALTTHRFLYPQYKPEGHELRECMRIEDIVKKGLERYKEYAGNVYIIEGHKSMRLATIRKLIEEHQAETGKTPFVLIDYLQLLAKLEGGGEQISDKSIVDLTVSELKRISRDFDTHVMAISSFNRDSYNKRTSMSSFKESGDIEYSADIVMSLEPWKLSLLHPKQSVNAFLDAFSEQAVRPVRFRVLKSRNSKPARKGVPLTFYPAYNMYEDGQSDPALFYVPRDNDDDDQKQPSNG